MQGDFRLSDWLVQPSLGRMAKDGQTVHVRAKVMDLLVYLARHPGEVIPKDVLLNEVWGTESISESALTRTITELRQALGDDVERPSILENIPKRGYRLIAPVVPETSEKVRHSEQAKPSDDPGGARKAIQTGATSRSAWFERIEWRWWLVVAAVGIGAAVLGAGWWPRREAANPAPRIKSLAVLPLKNLTGDSSQDYFVDGMTEALSATLSQIGSLTVTSNTSAMRYKNNTTKTAPQIAQELGGIDALVEGSVQRSGSQVRVTVSLLEAAGDRRMKTADFQRDITDIFALYRDIAQSVAREVSIAISPLAQARLAASRRPDPEAYDAYMEGRYHYARWPQEDALQTAIQYYEEAIAKDPTFARGQAALAMVLFSARPETPQPRIHSAARRAVDLDPDLPEARAALALVLMLEWDWSGSEAEFKRAIELDSNFSLAHQWYAQLLRQTGRLDEALSEARRAEELDPFALPVKTMVGWVLFNQHRYDDAVRLWDTVLELDPDYGLAVYNKGLVYAMKGLGEETILAAHEGEIANGRTSTGLADRRRLRALWKARGDRKDSAAAGSARTNCNTESRARERGKSLGMAREGLRDAPSQPSEYHIGALVRSSPQPSAVPGTAGQNEASVKHSLLHSRESSQTVLRLSEIHAGRQRPSNASVGGNNLLSSTSASSSYGAIVTQNSDHSSSKPGARCNGSAPAERDDNWAHLVARYDGGVLSRTSGGWRRPK